MNKKILVLFFHPRFENSTANKKLIEVAYGMPNVTVRDVYELYPDFNIDVAAEKELVLQHDVIIWQHPFYWYSCPPLMKQWIDLVLEYGWAYGKGGDKLTGKWIMNVLSSGGNFEVYKKEGRNRYTYREFLSPFDQTAFLCHMHYLPPFIVPGANRISDAELEHYAARYAAILQFLQSDTIDVNKLHQIEYFNQLTTTAWEHQFYKTH
jgi:glutathione-regulated potassium-efflux system ancillary protein KefG